MENDIRTRLDAQDAKLEAIWQSVEKSRKYFLITAWITIGAIVLPLIALALIIPAFMSSYTASIEGLL